jgi:hypothetical protein
LMLPNNWKEILFIFFWFFLTRRECAN